MTTARQFSDSEGDFKAWQRREEPCARKMADGTTCGANVNYRCWESSCGGYEDYQYRCENGHTWWIDGIDS